MQVPWTDRVRSWLPRPGSPAAFVFAVALVALAVVVRMPMAAVADQPLPPYITLYPAIVIVAFAGGIRVGMFAVLASALTAWVLWVSPPPTLTSLTPGRIMTGLVYLFTAAITVLISGLARMLLEDAAAVQEERTLAAREAVHRIKNLLVVIQSLSHKISATAVDVKTYRDQLDERLKALAIAQDLLLRRDWTDIRIDELICAALGPFTPNPRLELRTNCDAAVPRNAVTPLSMALYELATNSMKYGALASPEGFIRVETHRHDGRCSLEWREIGLAQTPPPQRGDWA